MSALRIFIPITVLTHGAYSGSRVTVQLFAIQLDASPFIVGVLTSLFAFLPMLFAIRAGREIDRIGMRRPLLAGTALVSSGVALPFALPALTTLYLSATLIGMGFMMYQIALQHAVGFLGKPEDRATNFSWLSLGYSTSAFVGPLVAGISIDSIGHRYTFLLLALGPLVPLLLFAFNRIRLPDARQATEAGSSGRVLDMLTHKQLKYSFVVTLLVAMGWDLFTFVIPIYGTEKGLSATSIGVVLACFAAATFLVRLALPFLVRRFPLWHMLTGTLVLAGMMFVVLPFISSLPVLMVIAFSMGLGLGAAQPMVMALLHNHSPAGRVGEALGLRSMLINTSQTALPLFFGAMSAITGVGPVFWILALTLLSGSWFVGGHARRRER